MTPCSVEEIYQSLGEPVGRDSSVGIATRYGLDGPGIESRWGARFSAPVLLYNGHRFIPGGKADEVWL